MTNEHANTSSKSSVEQNLSKDYVPKSKVGNLPFSNQIGDALKKQQDKVNKDLEEFKKALTKKYSYVEAIGVIPVQASKKIEEEYEVSEQDAKRELIHLAVIIPEKYFKHLGQVRLEAIALSKKINDKIWAHVMTPVDLWNLGMDSKFDIMEAISMSYPVLDKGILSNVRVAQLHKSLVLRKFEKYVTSYVIAGSLIRGDATKTSDVDVFIVIDDTDVKRMSRLELKEKLRGIIHSYIQEAQAIAGVKNVLNVQMYLLTEFWDSVKDAHPVMFTFIRDGVPLYDRGAFLPWKSLLRMGKIKPSPEAIDMFMSSGNKLEENVNRRLLDIAVLDIYWGVLTPSQGVLMLFGLAPPTPKETIKLIREIFFEKEKILEEKYVKIIENIVRFYKDYEHGKHKKISGTDLDKMIKDALDYMKRLRELRSQIEIRVQEKSIEEVYVDVFGVLEGTLKKKSESALMKAFEEELVNPGKVPKRFLEHLKTISRIKKELAKKKKSTGNSKKQAKDISKSQEVERAKRYAAEIIEAMVEYSQRKEFINMDSSRFILKTKEGSSEVFFLEDVFVVTKGTIQKISGQRLIAAKPEDLQKQLMDRKNKREISLNASSLDILKKAFGDFELVR